DQGAPPGARGPTMGLLAAAGRQGAHVLAQRTTRGIRRERRLPLGQRHAARVTLAGYVDQERIEGKGVLPELLGGRRSLLLGLPIRRPVGRGGFSGSVSARASLLDPAAL